MLDRRPTSLILAVVLVVTLMLMGIATEFVANCTPEWTLLEPMQRNAMPLFLSLGALAITVTIWLQIIAERSARKRRPRTSDRPPYPGLDAFTEDDAGVFFGREAQIRELSSRLHPNLPDLAHRFVAVIGPSGAGKSSLVRAGLLARLRRPSSRWVVLPLLVPGGKPIQSLADSLATMLATSAPDTVEAELRASPAALAEQVEKVRRVRRSRAAPVLLVIDQAEELLTLAGHQECLDFLELLRAALRQDPKLWVVATLRSEFLTGMLENGAADLFSDPVFIGPLDRQALIEVIEKPGAQADLAFAPGVVSKLVDDAGGGDALPLLAYTLKELYERVRPGGTVTEDVYRQLGGVQGTLAQKADQIVRELRRADADIPVLATLLKFVTVEGDKPTRRRVRRSMLTGAEHTVVDAFIAARLLNSDAEGGVPVVQVAHEALFRQWAPLAQAIAAAADDLRLRGELERWAQDWERSDHRGSYLLHGERLRMAEHWADRGNGLAEELPLVKDFLECSRRADHTAARQLSETVAKRAVDAVASDPEQGILLAIAAIECAETRLAHRALLAAVETSRVRGVLRGHQDMIGSVAWSPDGHRLATASGDRTARIWDLTGDTEPVVLDGHQDIISSVAWSPDGTRLATASGDRDRTARVWDAASGAELLTLSGHTNAVRAIAWSPDGTRLATGSHDGTARIWDAASSAELLTLSGHTNAVRWDPLESTCRHASLSIL